MFIASYTHGIAIYYTIKTRINAANRIMPIPIHSKRELFSRKEHTIKNQSFLFQYHTDFLKLDYRIRLRSNNKLKKKRVCCNTNCLATFKVINNLLWVTPIFA